MRRGFSSLLAFSGLFFKATCFTPASVAFSLSFSPRPSIISVGGSGGLLSFYDLDNPGYGALSTYNIGDGDVVALRWNPVFSDVLASISEPNRLIVHKFSDLDLMISTQAQLLRHPEPLLSCDWDPVSGTDMFVGTSAGFVYQYVVSFPGISSPSYTSIEYDSGAISSWFVGCPVTFVYRYNSASTIAGCDGGFLYTLNSGSNSYTSSLNLPRPVISPEALYKGVDQRVVALIDHTVYVIDLNMFQIEYSFSISPIEAPLSSGDVLSSDIYGSNLNSLAVRTTDGVAIYDLSLILTNHLAGHWSPQPLSLTELIADGASVSTTVIRQSEADNHPYTNVDPMIGYIEFTPCWNFAAQRNPLGDKSDTTCGSIPPVVAVEIFLPFSFTALRGSFDMISIGDLPGSDCAGMQGPISEWTANQASEWMKSLPTSSHSNSPCPLVADIPRSGPLITTVAECKSACYLRPECNMIFVSFDSKGTVEICNFHRCPSPNTPPAPQSAFTEIWTLITSDRSWTSSQNRVLTTYGGYVAFGTQKSVIHGGCSAMNGLIATSSPTHVVITQVGFPEPESVLRFQVSQYNAEPTIRIFNLQLEFLMPHVPFTKFFEVPNSPPGGYYLSTPDPRGAPSGPIVFSPDGAQIFTTSGDNSIISLSVR